MDDAEAREYAIAALEGFARELDQLDDESGPAFDLDGFLGRMRTAARRLEDERQELDLSDPLEVVRRAVFVVSDRVTELEGAFVSLDDRVGAIATRVLGGPPRAGFVPQDGEELERA